MCLQLTQFSCMWWSWEYVLGLIIINKSEVWLINHCFQLDHETMVRAACLTMFLSKGVLTSVKNYRIHSFQGHVLCTSSRDRFVYAPSQWETALHCNAVSHWLGAYTDWSLLKMDTFVVNPNERCRDKMRRTTILTTCECDVPSKTWNANDICCTIL